MKIKICAENKKISFFLPLSIIKWKLIWKSILKKAKEENKEEFLVMKQISPRIYKELKQWKKKNKKVTIVDIESSNGDVVKIDL